MCEPEKLSDEIRQYPFQDWTLPAGCQQDWADRAAELEKELAQWRVFAKGICAAYGIEVPMTTDRHVAILDSVINARKEAERD